jgi:thiol-disulfide isomerase/thioredoxin
LAVGLPYAALMQGTSAKQVAATGLSVEGELPSLAGASLWLNSPPLTPQSLRGKVVLVDFWTFTCINWLRTAPYIRGWAEKYKDQGLVVVGVHAPEFDFEHDIDKVRRAAMEQRVTYPIAVDNDFVVWRAFHNAYWPALYVVDAQGRIRHHQFGEGGYEETERVIQGLLAEAGHASDDLGLASVDARAIEAPADWASLQSPENYFGYRQSEGFAGSGGQARDRHRTYAIPAQLKRNQWALAGDWTIERGSIVLNEAKGRIAYRFHARDLNLVLARQSDTQPIRFRVTIDGAPPDADYGADIDAGGWGKVGDSRLYQLIRQGRTITDRTIEVEFFGAGARAYAATFG